MSTSCAQYCLITRRTPITGNGRGKTPPFAGLQSPAIAHNEFVASARYVTLGVAARDFPGNRSPPRWKFASRPKKNRRAWRRGALAAATMPLTASI
jgi:hypothetical protein